MVKIEIIPTTDKGNVFRLLEDLTVIYSGKIITVPKGFESDGASIPRFFWRGLFHPMDNRALKASIVHDYIYRQTDHCGLTRSVADDVFYDLLIENGVPKITAKTAWLGVRLGGMFSWN